MTYLRRALKYFIQMTLIVTVILLVLMWAGVVSWDLNVAFQHGVKSVWWILAIFAAISLAYPYFGYQKRKINVKGDPALAKPGLIEAMKGRGYVLASDTDGVLKFKLSSPLNRAARTWEDTITLSPVIDGWEVEGLTRDLVRVIGSIEYYFRNHGKD